MNFKTQKNKRKFIIKIASELFLSNGINNTSLADISKKLGISKGTLYYYYPSKEDIIYDIANTHLEEVTSEVLAWFNGINEEKNDTKEIIAKTLQRLIINDRGKLHLYLIKDAINGNENLRKKFVKKYMEWIKLCKNILDSNFNLDKNDLLALSYIIVALIDGFTIQENLEIHEVPLNLVASFLTKNL